MLPSHKTNHVEEAKTFLIEQFKGKPNIEGILSSWVQQFQDLEDVYWQILRGRTIDQAIGVQLDFLGALVGESRKGRNDAEYRAAIQLRIRINRSTGRAVDIYEIVSLMTENFTYQEFYPADFLVTVYFPLLAQYQAVENAIRQAKPAGVGASLVGAFSPRTETIRYGHTSAGYGLGYSHTTGIPRRVAAHVAKVG